MKIRHLRKFPCLFSFNAVLLISLNTRVTSQTILQGDHIIEPSNSDNGSLLIEEGDLTVAGWMQSATGVSFGWNSLANYGVVLSYLDSAKIAFFDINESAGTFIWREVGNNSLPEPKMTLDSNNKLSLFKSDGSAPGMTLDPDTGKLTFSTEGGGIYNSGGNAVFNLDSLGNALFPTAVSFSQGAQITGNLTATGDFFSNGIKLATQTYSTTAANNAINNKFFASTMSFTGGSATGLFSTAFSGGGASGHASTAFGYGAAAGTYALAAGYFLLADSFSEMALGTFNVRSNGSATQWIDDQNLFTLGNGNNVTRSNAITTLKNGKTTLRNKFWSSSNPTAIPTESASSAGDALIVEGHTSFKGNTQIKGDTVLEGKITINQIQGDINMGIYGSP